MSNGRVVYVYGLWDPRYCLLRYVGKTYNLKSRFRQHIQETERGKINKKCDWIRQLLSEELEPSIEILEECTEDNWQEVEKAWIKECKDNGLDLTNLTEGGENPPILGDLPNSEEIKKKMGATRKRLGIKPPGFAGKKHTEETRLKQSISIGNYYKKNNHPSKGNILTERHRRKIGEAHKGKPKSKDHIRKLFEGRDKNPNWRKNLSIAGKKRLSDPTNNPMYGKKQSDVSNEKNRLSNQMYHADRNNDIEYLFSLQEKYFEIAGHYQEKYGHL